MSKLFDEASLVMIPSAYKDGRLYSIRPVPEYGAELVTNGDFATDSNWSGSKTIANGQLTKTTTGLVYQGVIDTSVKEYYIIIDVETKAGSGLTAYLGGAQKTLNEGVNTFYLNSGGSNAFVGFNNGSGSVFNSISVKEVSNIGDFTFSRGSNLAATRVDVNGLIEKGRENLLLQSNQFDTTWVNYLTTETSGQSGYDGSSDAWLLTKSGANGTIYQSKSSSGVQTISVYAKKNTNSWLQIYAVGSPNVRAYFDLENGVLGTYALNAIERKIEDVGSGWYRCSVTFNSSLNTIRLYPSDGNNDESGTSGSIYIQDSQLEAGLVATDYIETTSTTAQAKILEDMPRLDYSASCPSLLLEPQRSNLVTYSEYFKSGWSNLGSRVAFEHNTTDTLSPEGKYNATKLTKNLSGNPTLRINAVVAGNPYVFTLWAKAGTSNLVELDISDDATTTFTLTDEWQRFEVKTSSAANNFVDISLKSSTAIGDYIYVWGAQVEQGSYPTSYIPTYGTSQTRSADHPDDLTLNYGNTFSALFDLSGLGGSVSNNFIIRFGSTNPIYLSVRKSDKKLQFYSPVSPTGYFATTATQKIAISCDGTNWTWSSDGQSGSLTATGANNANYIRIATDGSAGGGFPAALVKQIVLFETALTADELNSLTTL